MQIIEAKLSGLKIDPANVRQTDKAPDEGLLASIRAKGMLSPLTVRKNGGAGYYVTDGDKRLAALHILARDGDFDKTKPIQCALSDDDAAAAADTSLTLNFIREDMHPVDVSEAFAQLEKAAVSGERCPITGTNGLTSNLTGALARAGQIRIDVYPHNWRVVTIMCGPHAGNATAPPKNKD
jgi:hypothetical protein